jgi:hypothetical protein
MSRKSASSGVGHGTFREGATAGAIGATVVAAWFLAVDLLQGRPLHTPRVLGSALMGAIGWKPFLGDAGPILLYTVVHYAAFAALGIVAVLVVHASFREPTLLLGLFIVFVMAEVAIYMYILLLDIALLGQVAWLQIGLANVMAALAMGRYLWWSHPGVRQQLSEGLSGRGVN